jgi:hypothetical protein
MSANGKFGEKFDGYLEIVSNNPRVDADFAAAHGAVCVHRVEGSFLDVLTRAEDLLQDGRRLLSAPLPPNVPLMRAPFRSLLVEKIAFPGEKSRKSRKYDVEGLKALDKAMERVLTQRKNWVPPSGAPEAEDDFAMIDVELLLRALREVRLNGSPPS